MTRKMTRRKEMKDEMGRERKERGRIGMKG
jgi:hypothetical protein